MSSHTSNPALHTPHRPALLRAGGIPVLPALALSALLILGACTSGESREADTAPEAPERPTPVHVDSVFPIEEEIRRFREGLEEPSTLRGEPAGSVEELADRFLRALEAGDTEQITALVLDRAEFAWFYYPFTMYVERPYELSPALVWFQQQNLSGRGLTRARRQYEGKTLHDVGIDCPGPPEAHGPGRLHHGCRVLGELPDGQEVSELLFGSILELDGRFKFVSYANEL